MSEILFIFQEADGDEKAKTKEAETDSLDAKLDNGSTLHTVEKGQSEDEKPEKNILGGNSNTTLKPYVFCRSLLI